MVDEHGFDEFHGMVGVDLEVVEEYRPIGSWPDHDRPRCSTGHALCGPFSRTSRWVRGSRLLRSGVGDLAEPVVAVAARVLGQILLVVACSVRVCCRLHVSCAAGWGVAV